MRVFYRQYNFLIDSVVPEYVNFDTFSKDLSGHEMPLKKFNQLIKTV